jgi:hypothetical protein
MNSLFGSKNEFLPLGSANGRPDNGIKMSAMNMSVLLTLAWMLSSVVVMYGGYRHCRAYAYRYTLDCHQTGCTYTSKNAGKIALMNLDRDHLRFVETVRIDTKGEMVRPEVSKDRRKGRSGYSVRLRFAKTSHLEGENSEESHRLGVEEDLILTPYDIGRRTSRSSFSKIQKYINKDRDTVYVSHGSSVTVMGIAIIFLSLLSAVASCFIGTWSDASPRRLKKSR